MRFSRRRHDAPLATYAAVLDGAHLWLELDDGPASLRSTDSRDEHAVGAEPFDLGVLTGDTYDLVVRRTRVTLAPQPERHSPVAPDGVSRWQVTTDDGHLRLVRRTVAATAELDAVDVRGDRIHLRVRPVGEVRPGSHLLLLDQDDRVLASLPVTAHDGLLEALVSVDDLPPGWFGMLRVAVGTERDHVRIRRARNDLADAHAAVLLPELYVDGHDEPRARLRWNPEGLLALRSLEAP